MYHNIFKYIEPRATKWTRLQDKQIKKRNRQKKTSSNIKITDLHIQKKQGFQAKFVTSRKFP